MGAATSKPKGEMEMTVGWLGTSIRMVIPAQEPAGVRGLCHAVACHQEGSQGALPFFHSARSLPLDPFSMQHEVDEFPPEPLIC